MVHLSVGMTSPHANGNAINWRTIFITDHYFRKSLNFILFYSYTFEMRDMPPDQYTFYGNTTGIR